MIYKEKLNIKFLQGLFCLSLLLNFTSLAGNETLLKKPPKKTKSNTEGYVLFGKATVDATSHWRALDQISFYCENSSGEEFECFPDQKRFYPNLNFNEIRKAKPTFKYSSADIYRLQIGEYKITRIKYSRAVSSKGQHTDYQTWFYNIPESREIIFNVSNENTYIGKIVANISFNNTLQPVISRLKFTNAFTNDKKRASKRLYESIIKTGIFVKQNIKLPPVFFDEQYTKYGEWGKLNHHKDINACKKSVFKFLEGYLISSHKNRNVLGNLNKKFGAIGNSDLSNEIACGLKIHMDLNGYKEFRFTANPKFKQTKAKNAFSTSNRTLKIPVEFR